MQISGVDYGPAVPSGVSVCRALTAGATRLVDPDPRPRTRGDPRGPRADRSAPSRDSPQFVHEGLSGAARRAGHRQGRDGQPDPLVQGPRDVDRGHTPWQGRGGSAPTGRSSASRPATSGRASPTRPGRSGIPAIVFTSRHANRGKVERMRALGAEVIEVGEDFDSARGASEAYAAEHPVELLVDGDDPRISTGAATLALELTDAVAAGDLPAPVVASIPVGNGALINGVGSWLRARAAGLPRRRRPGRGRRGDGPELPAGPPDRHRVGRHLRRRDRDPGRHPARGRADAGPGRRDAARLRGGAPRGAGRS